LQSLEVQVELSDGNMKSVDTSVIFRMPNQFRLAPMVPVFTDVDGVYSERVVISFPHSVDDENLLFQIRNGNSEVDLDHEIIQSSRNTRILRLRAKDLSSVLRETDTSSKCFLVVLLKSPRSEIHRCECQLGD
jgi:hypothetical protein